MVPPRASPRPRGGGYRWERPELDLRVGAARLRAPGLAAGGAPARRAPALPTFEPRPGQLEMARAVSEVLESGGVLAVEAPTGIGKSLAYLLPAILHHR